METVVLNVGGMTCGGCVLSVEKALLAVPGVTEVGVSLAKKEAKVTGERLNTRRLQMALEDAGYDVIS